jgi:hypothetical protein
VSAPGAKSSYSRVAFPKPFYAFAGMIHPLVNSFAPKGPAQTSRSLLLDYEMLDHPIKGPIALGESSRFLPRPPGERADAAPWKSRTFNIGGPVAQYLPRPLCLRWGVRRLEQVRAGRPEDMALRFQLRIRILPGVLLLGTTLLAIVLVVILIIAANWGILTPGSTPTVSELGACIAPHLPTGLTGSRTTRESVLSFRRKFFQNLDAFLEHLIPACDDTLNRGLNVDVW